jgi:hypothetical protein
MGLETKIVRGVVTGVLTAGAALGLEGSTGRVSAVEAGNQSGATLPAVNYPLGTEVTLEMKDGSRVAFCRVGSDLPGMYNPPPESQSPSNWASCDVRYSLSSIDKVKIGGVEAVCSGSTVEPANPTNCKRTPLGFARKWWQAANPWEMQHQRALAQAARLASRP